MSKYEIKADGCDYGIYENGNLRLFVNSQANALLIKYVLEQDSQHKVVIADLLEKMSKKKRKFRAMTIGEHCTGEKKKCEGCEYNRNWWYCAYSNFNKVIQERDKNKPYKTRDGKYILIEVKE